MSFFDFSCESLLRFLGKFDTKIFFPAKALAQDKSKSVFSRAIGSLVVWLTVGAAVLFFAFGAVGKIFKPLIHILLGVVGYR